MLVLQQRHIASFYLFNMAQMSFEKPDLARILKEKPTLTAQLNGELGDTPNVYFYGNVVSWPLIGSQKANPALKKDSTLGIIQPGQYALLTSYKEIVTVLNGTLKAVVGEGELKEYAPLEQVVAEAQTNLHIQVDSEPVQYLCEYH